MSLLQGLLSFSSGLWFCRVRSNPTSGVNNCCFRQSLCTILVCVQDWILRGFFFFFVFPFLGFFVVLFFHLQISCILESCNTFKNQGYVSIVLAQMFFPPKAANCTNHNTSIEHTAADEYLNSDKNPAFRFFFPHIYCFTLQIWNQDTVLAKRCHKRTPSWVLTLHNCSSVFGIEIAFRVVVQKIYKF